MNEGIMFVIGCGALIGGIDRILGNRLGLGQKFEEGFQLMGATALSMAGIICLAPVLAGLLSYLITPVFSLAGIDPAMSGCILAIDMGGYQLSMGLAHEMSIGAFSGIIASSMAGCTLVFTIPVGMKVIAEHDRSDFLKGISAGLIGMPVGLLIGGLVQGLSFLTVLHQSLPVIVLSIILLYGLLRHTEKTVSVFSAFASFVQAVATVGLTIGAFQYITGIILFPSIAPLTQAMETAASIAIVMLGSLPLAELFRRVLHRPLTWLGKHTGMNDAAVTGMIVGSITVMPSVVMMKDMNPKGRIMTGAFLVCGAAVIGAHLGFAAGTQPQLITALLFGKLAGALAGMSIALLLSR